MTEVGEVSDIQDMQRHVDSYARCCADALLRGDMDAAHWHAKHYAKLTAEVRALCDAASDNGVCT